MSTVREIIQASLRTSGHGGLVNSYAGCGCAIEDFAPCETCDVYNCKAAYVRTDTPSEDREFDWEPGDVWFSTEKQEDDHE